MIDKLSRVWKRKDSKIPGKFFKPNIVVLKMTDWKMTNKLLTDNHGDNHGIDYGPVPAHA